MLWLKQTFSKFGEVSDVFIPKKRDIRGNAFAFVRLKDDSQASQATEALNDSTYGNKKLLVKRARFSKGDGSSHVIVTGLWMEVTRRKETVLVAHEEWMESGLDTRRRTRGWTRHLLQRSSKAMEAEREFKRKKSLKFM